MADEAERERPTTAMRPMERADSVRPTAAMPPLFSGAPLDRDHPGRIVAGYIVDGEVGRGGTGVVYAATHPMIGKRVAIKVLSHAMGAEPVALERFLLEARVVNAIGHANIVDIFDFGTLPDGRQFLIMDLLVGETLRARLRRGALAVGEAVTVIDECASALAAAHAKDIIHRDLKPDNVFIVVVPGRPAEIKLLDFGLGKLTTIKDGEDLTRAGAIVGTPSYMSPEQARARTNLDHRTDIYSLGVMSFHLLAGALPFDHDNVIDMLIAHVETPVPSLRARAPTVPTELARLVEAMMAKAADDRPTIAKIRSVLVGIPRVGIATMVSDRIPRSALGPIPLHSPAPPDASDGETTATQPVPLIKSPFADATVVEDSRVVVEEPSVVSGVSDESITESVTESGVLRPPDIGDVGGGSIATITSTTDVVTMTTSLVIAPAAERGDVTSTVTITTEGDPIVPDPPSFPLAATVRTPVVATRPTVERADDEGEEDEDEDDADDEAEDDEADDEDDEAEAEGGDDDFESDTVRFVPGKHQFPGADDSVRALDLIAPRPEPAPPPPRPRPTGIRPAAVAPRSAEVQVRPAEPTSRPTTPSTQIPPVQPVQPVAAPTPIPARAAEPSLLPESLRSARWAIVIAFVVMTIVGIALALWS